MAVTKTNLGGIAFLAFPDQKDFLVSELKDRFNIDLGSLNQQWSLSLRRPELVEGSKGPLQPIFYGDLLYLPDKSAFMNASGGKFPYWVRTCTSSRLP